MSKIINNQKSLIGAHVSVAGGLDQAILRGQALSCNTIQIFTQNNRRWGTSNPIPNDVAQRFKSMQLQNNIDMVISHASYLINLGSISPEIAQKSENALIEELERCEQLSIPYIVLHPGSGVDYLKTINQISQRIKSTLKKAKSNTQILLETMAGQGNTVGTTFNQLRDLLDLIDRPEKVGICFDTCHAWAAGYDFSDLYKYKQVWKLFDDIIGLENLKAMHINDSKTPLNSRVDRHANIGEGTLGIMFFQLLMNDHKFFNIPKIIETPKDNFDSDLKNLGILKNLMHKEF